jgi:diaminopimelate epimerase
MKISFFKMSGGGNDFIVIDNRKDRGITQEVVRRLCARKVGVGADGVLLLESSEIGDFKMRIINSDGSEAEMCGNGARCIAKFATLQNIAEGKMRIETLSGIINAEVDGEKIIVNVPSPKNIELNKKIDLNGKTFLLHFIDVGVPHVVLIHEEELFQLAPKIRHHVEFQPNGTNVNFVQVLNPNLLKVRTYERGVEDETLCCGTGCIAGACITSLLGYVAPPVTVKTKGGEDLKIYFELFNKEIKKVSLEGKVQLIYRGELEW